jgi:hypothetical protein
MNKKPTVHVYTESNGTAHNISVGATFTDSNGYVLKVIWCGPKRVKAVVEDHPEILPTYTAHWHFIHNTIGRGMLTYKLPKKI